MSEPVQTPPPSQPKADRRGRRERTRTVAFIILAVLITLFAVFNLERVEVSWIVGTGHAPLIVVIVISLLVGGVLTHFAERRASKRD